MSHTAKADVGIAQGVRVLPWNGRKAALSFTYDDADPCHLDIAIPEMEKRGMRGTFFVTPHRMNEATALWKQAAERGHEIANHSATHPHARGLTAEQITAEVAGAKRAIEQATGQRIVTFAYPFGEVTPELRKSIAEEHLAARVGLNRIQPLEGEIEWMDIPSMVTLTRITLEEYRQWFNQAVDCGGWCVLMVHGIEGTPWGWEPVPRAIYNAMLDEVAGRMAKDEIWTATFAEVAAYLRAQKEFERAQVNAEGTTRTWTWDRPATVPQGVVIKVVAEGKVRVEQGGRVIVPDGQGVYAVVFDAGELKVSCL